MKLIRSYKILCSLNYISVFISGKKLGAYGSIKYIKKSLGQKLSLLCYKGGRKVLSLPPLRKLFPNVVENWRKKRGSADFNAASEVMKKTLVLAVNEDLTNCLKNITAPTLLFWGDKDDATLLSDAKIMEKKIPDAGLVVLTGGSHFSFLENTPYFLRVADAFFEN